MKIILANYGDNKLLVESVILTGRAAAENMARTLLASADIIWPKPAPEPKKKDKPANQK